jgi:hypothetical protein
MPQPLYYEKFVERIRTTLERSFGPEKARALLQVGCAPYVLYDAGVRPGDILLAVNCPHFQLKMPGEGRFAERPPDLLFTDWEPHPIGKGFPALRTHDGLGVSSGALELRLYPLRQLDPLLHAATEDEAVDDGSLAPGRKAYGPPASAVIRTAPDPQLIKLLRSLGRQDAIRQHYAQYGLEPPAETESLESHPAEIEPPPAAEDGLMSVQTSPLPHLPPLAVGLLDLLKSNKANWSQSRKEHARLLASKTKKQTVSLDAVTKTRRQVRSYLAAQRMNQSAD